MKIGIVFCSVASLALTGCIASGPQARDGGVYDESAGPADASYAEIRTESDFYEPLSPYGRWEVVGADGRCWIPGGVDADWSPYSNGYWQETDAGWYWASDEPWGWATYHYGRWDSSPQFGWYWVPQTQWAPAWVSWREGGGYVGWAPLGPSGRAVVALNRRGAAPGGYIYVEERRFLDHVRPTAIMVDSAVINRTAINRGPGAATIEKASGRRMLPVAVRELRRKEEAKVVFKHPTQTSPRGRTGATPDHRPAETAAPAREPRQVANPAMTRTVPPAPPPPTARNEVHQADQPNRAVQAGDENRGSQQNARSAEGEKTRRIPSPVAKHEATPGAKHETQPPPPPEVRRETPPQAKADARPEVKHDPNAGARPAAKPVAKQQARPAVTHEPKPEAKVESTPAAATSATAPPAAAREHSEHTAGKDEEKKN